MNFYLNCLSFFLDYSRKQCGFNGSFRKNSMMQTPKGFLSLSTCNTIPFHAVDLCFITLTLLYVCNLITLYNNKNYIIKSDIHYINTHSI